MSTKKNTAFIRFFTYIKPQWRSVVAIVLSAAVIGVMFSMSFMAMIPVLKVMMGEEGLHGWVDRKACSLRYGINFDIPDIETATQGSSLDYLLVNSVKEDEAGAKAQINRLDRIIGIGSLNTDGNQEIASSTLLEELAKTKDQQTPITIKRVSPDDTLEVINLTLNTTNRPFYIQTMLNIANTVPRGVKGSKTKAIQLVIIFLLISTIIRCIATFIQKYLADKVVMIATNQMRRDLFKHAMYMPIGFFSAKGTSDTISRIVTDIAGTGNGMKVLLGNAIREPMKALAAILSAMIISTKLTLIFLGSAPFVVGVGAIIGRSIRKHTKKSLKSSALMLGKLDDSFNALSVVKVYNRQEHEIDAYRKHNEKFLKQTLRVSKADAATQPIMEVFGMIAGAAALILGAYWVMDTNKGIEASGFFILLGLLGSAAESMRKSSNVWNKVQGANACAERVFSVIDEPLENEDKDAYEIKPLKKTVEFKDIVFTYPGNKKPTLNGMNLTVEAGHNVAVVGPNGSGKSTFVNLLPRFYDVDSGQILIDGQDIAKATLKSLRGQLAMVTQKVVTFNDTIENNIRYGNPDATMDEVIDAAKRAYAHEFIEPLPNGYQSFIGENGAGLSGGQLQRIVIARAILKNPEILIFDEATSQVDAESESKIHTAIEEVMKDRTSFIIAHRFSTVISADKIVVVDNGQIIAQGQHSELIKNCPLYQSLYETQLVAPK